jgi:hypothetical protein
MGYDHSNPVAAEEVLLRIPFPSIYCRGRIGEGVTVYSDPVKVSSVRDFHAGAKLRGSLWGGFKGVRFEDLPKGHQRRFLDTPVMIHIIQRLEV